MIRLGEGGGLALSPDGKWALAAIPTSPAQAVVYPVGPGDEIRLPRGGIESYSGGSWFPDGKRVLLCGNQAGKPARCFVQDLAGGDPKPLTPEGFSPGIVSPDGRRVIAWSADGWGVLEVAGGSPVPVAGLTSDRSVSGWTPDGRAVYTWDITRFPSQVERVDIESGRSSTVMEIEPADLTGVVRISNLVLADDPGTYAYCVVRQISTLFLVRKAR